MRGPGERAGRGVRAAVGSGGGYLCMWGGCKGQRRSLATVPWPAPSALRPAERPGAFAGIVGGTSGAPASLQHPGCDRAALPGAGAEGRRSIPRPPRPAGPSSAQSSFASPSGREGTLRALGSSARNPPPPPRYLGFPQPFPSQRRWGRVYLSGAVWAPLRLLRGDSSVRGLGSGQAEGCRMRSQRLWEHGRRRQAKEQACAKLPVSINRLCLPL